MAEKKKPRPVPGVKNVPGARDGVGRATSSTRVQKRAPSVESSLPKYTPPKGANYTPTKRGGGVWTNDRGRVTGTSASEDTKYTPRTRNSTRRKGPR